MVEILWKALLLMIPILGLSIGGDFFGLNYWYFEKLSEGERRIVVEELRKLEIDTLRIGGLWYDAKGVKRWVLRDFFSLCEELGATPIVQIPLNSHEVDEMLSFVDEVREIYSGRIIWSLGNEPDIYEVLDFPWLERESLDEVLRKYEEFLRRFDRGGDVLIFPDITRDWRNERVVREFLEMSPDVFSVHRYPFGRVERLSDILRDVERFTEEMSWLKSVVDVPVAITETNLSWDWNFHGEYSPEGEYAGIWLVSIYLRSIILDLWNVSFWSAVNDSSLSLLLVENGKVVRRPSFEFLRVFKGVPRRLERFYTSEDLDWVKLGGTVVAVNRSWKVKRFEVDGVVYEVPPMGVVRYDGEEKTFERRVER